MRNHLTPQVEMNYCHRCGTRLTRQQMHHIYLCEQGHTIYANASPAAAVILFRGGTDEVLVMARAQQPGVGRLTIPGGFCNGAESMEDGVVREVSEETKLTDGQYGKLYFVTSDLDLFVADGERIPVSAVVFTARLEATAVPELDQENQWYKFVRLSDLDIEAFWSPTIQKAFRMLQADPALIPQAKT